MQEPAVRDILDDVVTDRHAGHADDEHGPAHMVGADEGEPRPLRERHRRQQDDDLVREHPGQNPPVTPRIDRPGLERRERARAVEIFEPQPEDMISRSRKRRV